MRGLQGFPGNNMNVHFLTVYAVPLNRASKTVCFSQWSVKRTFFLNHLVFLTGFPKGSSCSHACTLQGMIVCLPQGSQYPSLSRIYYPGNYSIKSLLSAFPFITWWKNAAVFDMVNAAAYTPGWCSPPGFRWSSQAVVLASKRRYMQEEPKAGTLVQPRK